MSCMGEWLPQTLDQRLDRLESLEAIRQLASRYALAVDTRDMQALADLFEPEVKVGPRLTGRAALRDWFAEAMSHAQTSIHFVGNHVIEFSDADHATGIVYCHDQLDRPDFQTWDVGYLLYGDTYIRVDGEWVFSERRLSRWYLIDALERPAHGKGVNSGHDPLRASQLPEMFHSWQRYWDGVSARQAGTAPQ